jgi:hypothetical protein
MTGKPRRVRIEARVSPDTQARLRQYCAMRRKTASAVIETSLREHLDGIADPVLLMRRLDRLGRGHHRLERDMHLLMEAFGSFVRFWFAHTPPVAGSSKESVQLLSEERYAAFVGFVSSQIASGHRFLDDLPAETVADGDELAEAAAGSAQSQAKP